MCSGYCGLAIGVFALVLIYGSILGLLLWAVVCERRAARRRRGEVAEPCSCPEPELTTLGVYYHPAGEEGPMRALLDAERIGRDTVSLILQPADGSDQAAINMPRATVDPVRELLAKARDQEVRHG